MMIPNASRVSWFALLLCMTATAFAADEPAKVDPLDWPYWRGPEMNGASRETGLVKSWSPKGENLLWMREDLGTHSTPIVMNGKMYVLTRNHPQTQKEGEKVVCVDAATGETIWENEFNVFLSEVPDVRVAWSNVTGDPETGHIYALGVCDLFQCIDGETGKTLWSHSLSEEYGLLNTYGGRTAVPLIFEDLVIINGVVIGWGDLSKPAHRFIAFNKRTGEPVWIESTRLFPEDTTYSSAAVAVIGGQSQYVIGGGDGSMYSFQPRTGKKIWSYDVSPRGINTSPLIVGDMIYCGHSEENVDAINTMGAFFAIDGKQSGNVTKTNIGWKSRELMVGKSSPIMVNDRIIAIDDSANLFIVDPSTGKVTGKKKLGASMRSSPVYGDGKIYTCTLDGRWAILELQKDGKGVKVLHQLRLNKHESDGSPIISHGRIYLPTSLAMFCIGDKDHTPAADPAPTPVEEAPVADDEKPAQVQIVPVEALIKPGQTQQLTARLFNAKGQFLRDADPKDVQFEIAGAGSIEGGVYQADAKTTPNAAIITAKFADLTGGARIRVIPDLPWKEDFSSGEVPITWVGMRARHIVLDYDLLQALEAKDPQAGKLYIYLQTGFTNSGRPALKYDNTTPQQTWTEFRRYLGVIEQTTNLDQSKTTLDPLLQILVDEKVLAKWEWGDDGKGGVQLSIQKGPRGVEGNAVMTKITTIPKGAKSQGWMGPVDLHDYTVQADVMAANRNNRLPDIGLTAQRYYFNLGGASQELRINTWPPQPNRTNAVLPFQWQADTWYTLKFQAVTEGDHVTLRGKVWPRGDQEPADWTIEVQDPAPNLNGSPGMLGNARDAEIYIDNLQVTSN